MSTKHTLKPGLSYISERTSTLRYSDKDKNEKWLQPLSEYVPLVEIKRGQPVSVATYEDFEEVVNNSELTLTDEERTSLLNNLKSSHYTFITLTNPLRHNHCIGLAYEYSEGIDLKTFNVDTECEAIHVLGNGRFDININYLFETGQVNQSQLNSINNEEYIPEFFNNDFNSLIGKTVYVQGLQNGESEPGLLTIIKEDAYLAYNNIIQVGFISDAFNDTENKSNHPLTIEVQIDGDDRGVIDSTIFEAELGEDVNISENDPIRVFAIGQEDPSNFKFTIRYKTGEMPAGFIALQKLDGKTRFIKIGNDTELSTNSSNLLDEEDRAFIRISQYNDNDCLNNIIEYNNDLNQSIQNAFSGIREDEENNLSITVHNDISTHNEVTFEATKVGGFYEIYVSSNLTESCFFETIVESHGSIGNRGKAILADIRIPERQNLLGIYCSHKYGLLKKGSKAIFMKTGLFKIPETSEFKFKDDNENNIKQIGKAYYLSSRGKIIEVPQEYLDTIAQIGVVQSPKSFIVDLREPRKEINGDLPVGYMKPSVHGYAEFGFLLMDGTTKYEIEKYKKLYDKLLSMFVKSELQVSDGKFVLPLVTYKAPYLENNQEVFIPAQIKWLSEGIYQDTFKKEPFIRKCYDLIDFGPDGELKNLGNKIPKIDITPLITYGPGKLFYFPDIEALDIRLFVDLRDLDTIKNDQKRIWTELRPGFHEFNNIEYYGFEWRVIEEQPSSEEYPMGLYSLTAVYSPKIENPNEDTSGALGPMFQETPFSPPAPIEGHPLKIFIAKRDYYSRQFDVENLFSSLVKNSVTDLDNIGYKNVPVTGKAVQDFVNGKLKNIKPENFEIGNGKIKINNEGIESSLPVVFNSDVTLSSKNKNYGVKFADGLLKYSESGEDSSLLSDITNEDEGNDLLSLVPYKLLKSHIENTKSHNLDPDKLNAVTLSNVSLLDLESIKEEMVPFLKKGENNNYSISLGTELINYDFNNNNKIVKKSIVSKNINELKEIENWPDTNNNLKLKKSIYFGKEYDGKRIPFDIEFTIPSEGEDDKGGFLTISRNGVPVSINDNSNSSSRDYKEIVKEFKNDILNPNENWSKYKESFEAPNNDTTDENLTYAQRVDKYLNQSALQAAYVIPIASFRYKNEGTQLKRWFGIITERISETKLNLDNFVSDSVPEKDKNNVLDNAFPIKIGNELAGVYNLTEDESKSIKEYLTFLTTNNEKAQNILSSVGLLLEAAKETQERLLAVEASTFGADSPTIPGNKPEVSQDDVPEWANQLPTILGLNRLIKALCAEVFQVPDPQKLVRGNVSLADYSRLDDIDKSINGEGADPGIRDKEGELHPTTTYSLNKELGKSYVQQGGDTEIVSRETAYSENNSSYLDSKAQYEDGDKDIREDFDGLNNAVNRIAQKVDTLTEHLNGSNNPVSRPELLDRIRDNVETVIKEVYNEEYIDNATLSGNKFKESKISKIKTIKNFIGFDDDNFEEKNGDKPLISGDFYLNKKSENTTITYELPELLDTSILAGYYDDSSEDIIIDDSSDSGFDDSSSSEAW